MPIDPSIISNSLANIPMPDVNALMQQRVRGAENIYQIETARQAQAAEAEQEAAQAQEAATIKALLPAYTYGIQTGDIKGAGNLVSPELRPQLQQYIDALTGRSPEEVKAALIGSLSSSPAGQEALAAIQRGQTFGVQQGQLTLAQQRFAAEQAAANQPKRRTVASTQVDAEGNVSFFDDEGNLIRVEPKAGKPTMPAAGVATSDQKTQARQGVDGTLSRIKEQYDILKKEKEIVSTENTAMENIAARTKTKLGPSVGRTVGTKAQSARDTIANLRQALLADIKAATGMSSKAIDSNVELQSFLASLGDPDQSFETIRDTLAELSKKYGTGTFGAEDAEPPPAEAAPTELPEGATTTNW